MSQYGLLMDAESIQYEQQCAIRNLCLLHDLLWEDIMSLEAHGALAGVGHLQTLAEAMSSVATSLSRSNELLRDAVDNEYKKRKEGLEHE